MARPREFDCDETLQRALRVFWEKGYEATSVQDLVDAMGIHKASLYATFGDKHTLYLSALRDYQQKALIAMESVLRGADSPLAGVRAMIQSAADRAAGRAGKVGCFCVNANVELAPRDPQVATCVRTHAESVERMIALRLEEARHAGELPKPANTERIASFVFGILMALNVLGKQRASRERLQALVDHAFIGMAG